MYPGGKNTSYRKIINLIPPHKTYIEAFTGSGAVGRYKLPAEENIFIELNEAVLCETQRIILEGTASNGDGAASPDSAMLPGEYRFYNRSFFEIAQLYQFRGGEFIYADPPYLMHTRKQKRPLYEFEMDDREHEDLLRLLIQLSRMGCKIMLSGYWSEMYADYLGDWHTCSFMSQTRGGSMAEEWLWMNYPEPKRLHDYRYLGDDFRERERIKRKRQRWAKKLAGLDVLEQRAILWAIEDAGLFKAGCY